MARIGEFIANLLDGGTLEIVLLIVLIIVGIILLLVALWLLWKLAVLLGKGILWLSRRGSETVKQKAAARREDQLARPPAVSVGWGSARLGLRVALAEARRLTGSDALCVALIAGDGGADLCRSLGLTPPGAGVIGIAAGGDTIFIDASRASRRELGRLARALPWRRPVDGLAVVADANGIPAEAVARAASFARATSLRVALHLVLPSTGDVSAWRIIDADNSSGDAICTQLAGDTVRSWLVGGSREGLKELALAQSRELPSAINRVLSVAPSSLVDVASLGFSGTGLRGAVAQSLMRTRPLNAPGVLSIGALAAFAAGVLLTVVVGFAAVDRSSELRGMVNAATREARAPWNAEGVDAVPSGARLRRVSGLGLRLADQSEFSVLMPLAALTPNYSAPQRLGAAFLGGYLLRPLGAALEREATQRLEARADPASWIDDAQVVGEWVAAWEGLADDPAEVDVQRLLASAFGGTWEAWPEGVDVALIETDTTIPLPEEGGLDTPKVEELARSSFIRTMQLWADTVYTDGPITQAARRAVDPSANWREQHTALSDLRRSLQDPAQQWLTAAEDRPDHAFELRHLGQAVGLSLVGQVTTVEAKASISRIRIDAREQIAYFIMPEIGPLLVRTGSGSGPSLSMTREAAAWLGFLDKVANAGFDDLPAEVPPRFAGLATIDAASIARTRDKLRVFERFSASLPAEIPPAQARRLVGELTDELVIGVTRDVEGALRRASDLGIARIRAERRANAAAALEELQEIEAWMRDRQAVDEANRLLALRTRVADGVLDAAADVLVEEDPLGVHVDPTADSNALVRRFERGLGNMRRLYEQLAKPYVDAAAQGAGWAALHWRDMGDDLDSYARGDVDSSLSALEGLVRAYAEQPSEICDAPRPLTGRGDYLALTASRFRGEIDDLCRQLALAEALAVFEPIKAYFEEYVEPSWPFARRAEAPELSPATLTDFLDKVRAGEEVYSLVDDPLVAPFAENATFWARDTETAALRFRIEWRAHKSEELLAEHVAQIDIEGADADEDGVYTWRYGVPFSIHVRLAKNSAYRFLQADGRRSDVWVVAGTGNGGFLRVFEDLSDGVVLLEADVVEDAAADVVVDGRTVERRLRLSARIVHDEGRPMSLPVFSRAAY